MVLRDLLCVEDLLRPVVLITWAVPAERVQPRLHPSLELDTAPGPDGAPQALLSVAVVLNVGAHLRALPGLRLTCAQANFRTYVRPAAGSAVPGVYFFANYLSARAVWLLPALVSPNVHYTRARMVGRVPARRGSGATWHVSATMRGPLGTLDFAAGGDCVPATDPFLWTDAAAGHHFLTQRLGGYFATRRGDLGVLPVDHAEMTPWSGAAQRLTCDPWEQWGLLSAAEIARPLAVLAQPAVLFRAYLPARLAGAT